jgi:hypothetical protein
MKKSKMQTERRQDQSVHNCRVSNNANDTVPVVIKDIVQGRAGAAAYILHRLALGKPDSIRVRVPPSIHLREAPLNLIPI